MGGQLCDRRRGRTPGCRGRDRDRPPHRAAPARGHGARRRIPPQRRHRTGVAAYGDRGHQRHHRLVGDRSGLPDRGRRRSDRRRTRLPCRGQDPHRAQGPAARHRDLVGDAVRGLSRGRRVPRQRRDRGGRRRPAARAQGADPADRPIPPDRAYELADDLLSAGEHGVPADRAPGVLDPRRGALLRHPDRSDPDRVCGLRWQR